MFHFLVREWIFIFGFFANLFHERITEVYVDGTKSLRREFGNGAFYANFASHKFGYLNITVLRTASEKGLRECGKFCAHHSSCFSVNVAAFPVRNEWILCELLPNDRYKNSNSFTGSSECQGKHN